MRRTITLTALMAITFITGYSQHLENTGEDMPVFYDQISEDDSLKHVLHDLGTFEGHFRTFFMNTVNDQGNPDYFALAMGGGIAYYSPVIRNFQLGLSGFIIYNLASSELAPNDGYANRYEVGLFDVTDPENKGDLDRLENLFLRYYINSSRKSLVQLGKFHMRSPSVNPQDGRMRPNLQEGLWMEFKEWEKLNVKGGWLWRTSPRSTVDWYGMGQSVGIYPNGKAVNGRPAAYAGYVNSNALLIGSVEWKPLHSLNYQYWNYYADNLFNIAFQKVELKKKLSSRTWVAGVQYLWEKGISHDMLATENQYIGPDEQSHVFSGKVAVMDNVTARGWSLNYTRVTAHGRFLFPREWGIEPFYTFINRERNEGAGDVHALMLEHTRSLDRDSHLSFRGRSGVYRMPAVNTARLNKYAMPSYYQLSAEAGYKFKGFLHGLETQMLYAYKGNLDGSTEYEPMALHNKTGMHHLSVRFDYTF